ncbi:MAG: hypothetical protein LM577_04715 [Thermoproteaceae archaeon]|jgi:hypothetical protein|nr:hypothetical protein [Thermoproteaceae archaeon]
MEVVYLVRRLGQYLGGIDVERIRELLAGSRASAIAVERLLGISVAEGGQDAALALECARLARFLELYRREERRLLGLRAELRAMGVAPSETAPLRRRIRSVRRALRVYGEILQECLAEARAAGVSAGHSRHCSATPGIASPAAAAPGH